MGTLTITNPEDASVKIGGSAVFKADLSSTASDYRATNYKWQTREKGGKWQTIDGANGKIVGAVAGKVDQIANIETGFVLASGATDNITTLAGYRMSKLLESKWKGCRRRKWEIHLHLLFQVVQRNTDRCFL